MQTENKEEIHQLEYNIYSCKVSWCPICNEHFYNERNISHTTFATKEHYHIVTPKQPSPPVEQTVDAGQLEKVIGDAFEAGKDYRYAWQHFTVIESLDKERYIKQAIEQFNNLKK